jgi:hypothetical protein
MRQIGDDEEHGDVPHQKPVRLNPAILEGVPPLIGLDDLKAVVVQPAAPMWARWLEGVGVHVVGAATYGSIVLLAIAFGSTLNLDPHAPTKSQISCGVPVEITIDE